MEKKIAIVIFIQILISHFVAGSPAEKFPGKAIELLLGGFHLENKSKEELKLISDFMRESGIQTIAPSHCTG
jgi:metal-dependent hydrolase (beta-lactamase superfamily II)